VSKDSWQKNMRKRIIAESQSQPWLRLLVSAGVMAM
jgi:hypothetical protein